MPWIISTVLHVCLVIKKVNDTSVFGKLLNFFFFFKWISLGSRVQKGCV